MGFSPACSNAVSTQQAWVEGSSWTKQESWGFWKSSRFCQTRAGAEDYADEVFGHVEQSLDTLLNNVRRCRDRLNANAMAQGRQ